MQSNNYHSQTAEVNGVKMHYLKAGSGKKPLVLLHGFGDTSRMWIPLFEELGLDYTIIAPDLRGLAILPGLNPAMTKRRPPWIFMNSSRASATNE